MLKKTFVLTLGLLASSMLVSTANASNECPAYDEVTARLAKKYGEQRIFSGFSDNKDSNASTAIYEFWSNPERGTWSLVAHKLVLFQYSGQQVTRSCAFVVNAGKSHNLVATKQDDAAATATAATTITDTTEKTEESATTSVTATRSPSCIPHSQLSQNLGKVYHEVSVVQAMTDDNAMLEIYGSDNSWTITRAKVQGVKNPMTGMPLTDQKTGQEIQQMCSSAVFSGKSWGLFETTTSSI